LKVFARREDSDMTIQLLRIEQNITAMEAGEFQILCDAILSAKDCEKRISPGRKLGSKKQLEALRTQAI